MKVIKVTIVFQLLFYIIYGQSVSLEWAKSMGKGFIDIGNAIGVDAAGNVYTMGDFRDTADFDPGPATFNLISAGLSDVFIQKIDSSGNFVWAKRVGGPSDDNGWHMVVDSMGNVYTIGIFEDTADFDPGPGIYNLMSKGFYDAFIQKLDASGNMLWVKQIGGIGYEKGNGIAVDNIGNVYTTGIFWNKIDFNPGLDTFYLTSGLNDAFIQKLDSSGNFVWAKQVESPSNDAAWAITVDDLFNVYITGDFENTADFDPGPSVFNLTSLGPDNGFVLKLDSAGNFIWAKQMGRAWSSSIAVDVLGNVYTTGTFSDTGDFDPGPSTFNLIAEGSDDIFIQKLDASGNFLWAKSMGGSYTDMGLSIVADNSGNTYTTGYFQDTVDFDPGPGTFYFITPGVIFNQDIFIQKLDTSGNFIWAMQMGNISSDFGLDIVLDEAENIYITGTFADTVDFDPGPGTYNLSALTSTSVVFSLKFSQSSVGIFNPFQEDEAKITITPNPFSNSAVIELAESNNSNKEYSFAMYDLLGREALEFQVTSSKFKVDRGNLSEGLYIYKLYSQEGVLHTGKLSIQ